MERRAGVDAPHGDERSVERLMDAHLKAHGLCRKRIAKDGSCLFRAVAEQVLHCQSLHTRVRAECVKYLREKRDLYESFIEGDFEEYLRQLQDPQSWVGQVEISALAVLYKHDFIIYQNPEEPPVNITQNGYPDKVLLCFLNGNHYDSVYRASSVENAAVCQSILYELLYDRVFHMDRSALTSSLRMSKVPSETIITEERESSGNSDLDEGEDFWSGEVTSRPAGVNNRTAHRGRGRGQARGVGRGCLRRKVQESLSPSHFRNVEYEVWLRSKRVQQRKDFCMAAGMHYKAGDKCQVRLNNTDRFYGAYIQDVSADDGPVTVFIEELGEKYSVPLWNLRSHSEESWSTVTEKPKRQTSTNGNTERDPRHGRNPMRSMSQGSPQSTVESQSLGKNGCIRRSDPGTGGYGASPLEEDHALLEFLNKDEENFPSLEASAQAVNIDGSRRPEKKGTRKKAAADTKEQSLNPSHKAERGKITKKSSVDQDQRISPPLKEELIPTQSSTLPAPSAPKLTKAAPGSKTPLARVPYKSSSSISARIPTMQSQTAPASSSRPPVFSQTTHIQSPTASAPSIKPLDSFQTTPVQSPTASAPSIKPLDSSQTTPVQSSAASAPSTKPLDSIQTTPIQSPVASTPSTKPPDSIPTTPIQSSVASTPSTKPLDSIQITPIPSPPAFGPSSRPPDSSQTTAMQSPTAPAPPTRPIVLFEDTSVKSQAALKPSGVISVSSQTNLAQLQSLPMPTTSLNTPISFQSTPTQCLTMPKTSPVTTTSVPQNLSQTIQSQGSDRPAAVTTPVTLSLVPEAITPPILSQPRTIPVSPCATAPNPISTPVSSPSSTQSASSLTHTISQTVSVTTQSPAQTQIPSATELPSSTELFAASNTPSEQTASEQPDSADAPTHIHVSHSITPPAQPAPSLAPPYHIGFGTHLPYPPYPPYPAPMPSFSPNTSAPMPDPCLPPTVPTPPFAHAPQPYLCDPAVSPVAGAGGALVPDAPSQHPFSVQQICQDPSYPGFPQNEKGEAVPLPPFSYNTAGKDLPNDTSVLRFFFNLGLKAYMYQMLAPVTYLAPLYQAYQHMQFKVPSAPVCWQPENNSRPIFPSPNPSPAGSTPFSHFDIRGMVRTPSPLEVGLFSHHSLPMQMPLPGASHPNVYAGMHPVPPAGPSQQYSAPPQSVGPQHFSVPHPRHYGTELHMPTVLPIIEGAQRGFMPHVEKQFCPGQGQQHSEGGDIKPVAVPVTIEMQHSSVAQSGVPSKGADLAALANGNRQGKGSDFIEEWQTEKAEFSDADLKTGRSYYKSGFRRGADERGGYRGRGQRGKREYTAYGRQDGQVPYYRGGRSRGRGYNNTKATGYPSRQFTPAPES